MLSPSREMSHATMLFVLTLLLPAFILSQERKFDLCVPESDPDVTNYTLPHEEPQNCGCANKNCIRKCCKPGFNLGPGRICRKLGTNTTFSVPVYRKNTFIGLISGNDHFIVGQLPCIYFRLNSSRPNDEFYLQDNGKLLLAKIGKYVGVDRYCVDEVDEYSAFLCSLIDKYEDSENINAVGMIISMPFLLTTFLVYLLLPDKNVHQKALMLYVLSLLLAYVLLVAINLASNLSGGLCTSVGYLTLFFFMVSFFWMNVICFDIWYTFSGGRGYIGSRKNSENRRFLMYSAYAFGFPLLLLLVVFGMDKLPIDDRHKGKIGESKCFINDGWPQLWYLYLEAAILVIANILFFVLTALKIRQVKRETIMLKQSESKRHTFEKDKQRFNLFLKLLLAMGVNWSMEVISWLVNWITMDTVQYIWYLTDFVNAAYGVIIFFIFVFKKKIWRLLKKRYYNFIGKPNLARTVTTTETRTSHYSSTNYSNTDTHLTERTGVSGFNNGRRSEEIPLQKP